MSSLIFIRYLVVVTIGFLWSPRLGESAEKDREKYTYMNQKLYNETGTVARICPRRSYPRLFCLRRSMANLKRLIAFNVRLCGIY